MARTDFTSVDEYLETKPAPARRVLRQVRTIIRRALPGADEVISYQIPAYRLDGRVVVYFAGWATHFSIYPVTGQLVKVLGMQITPYVASKGTLRFPLAKPVPAALIARVAKLRAKEVRARRVRQS